MGLLSALAGPLLGAAFTALAGLITAWLRSKQDQQTGANVEAAKITTHALAAETAIAQAEANAPDSQSATVQSLSSGQF